MGGPGGLSPFAFRFYPRADVLPCPERTQVGTIPTSHLSSYPR